MSEFRAQRIVRTHQFELPMAMRDAFDLFTPEGNATLQALDAPAYEAFIDSWGSSIRATR